METLAIEAIFSIKSKMENLDAEESFICCICKITDILCSDFVKIGRTTADNSKKPLISVINHLLQSINSEDYISVTAEDVVCNHCYHELLEYDDIIMKLLNSQKRFKKLLHSCKSSLDLIIETTNEKETATSEEHPQFLDSHEIEVLTTEQLSPKNVEVAELDSTDMEIDFENVFKTKTKCHHCDKMFYTKRRLAAHIQREHANEGVFRCHVCRKVFRNDEYLELHMNLHEGKTERDCRYCSKRFSRRVNVIRHMQKHWNKKKYQCEKCGLRFADYTLLYNHRLLHEAEEVPLICEVCQQSFKTSRTYKNHLRTHKKDRIRYPCEICGKPFLDKYTLKVHRRTHELMTEENEQLEELMSTYTTECTENINTHRKA